MFQYEATIKRVVDGDTLTLLIDLGFHVYSLVNVRLARINAPDEVKFGVGGIQDPSRDFIMQRCPPGAVVVVDISRQEKYGRWLADVYYKPGSVDRNEILKDSLCLNDELVKAGLAVPYDGGRK